MLEMDCIGLGANEALNLVKANNPNMKIVIHPTTAPRHKGALDLSKCMVVRQRCVSDVLELTVVMID